MNGRKALLVVAGLGWAGIVLAAAQRGEPPVGIAALALLTVWVGTFALAAWGGGVLLHAALLRRRPRGVDEALVALVLGTAVLTAIAAGLGCAGLLRPPALLATLLILGATGAVALVCGPRADFAAARVSGRLVLPLAIVGCAWALVLSAVTTDSAFFDQLHYHLAFPALWLRAGRVLTFARHDYSFYPAGMGLLHAYALAALGPWAAQATHAALGALAVFATARLALRFGGPGAACWSAAVLSATPVVVWLATLAGADLGVAAFGAAGWLALALGIESADHERAAWCLVAGIAAGLAAGAKLLAVLTVGAPLFIALLLAPGTLPQRARRLLPFALGAALPLAPWLLRNLWVTGNPVYPFLPGLLARAGDAALAAQRADAQGTLRFLSDPLRVATLGALGPRDGSVGPLFLLLAPLAVWCGVRSRGLARLLLVGSAVGVLGWAMAPPTARYLTPVLVPLAALCGAGIGSLLDAARGRTRIALSATAGVVCLWSMLQGVDREILARAAATLGRDRSDAALARFASYWPAVDAVNLLPAASRVLLVGESRTLYFEREVLFEDPFRTPLLAEIAQSAGSSDAIAAELRERGVTHVLINGTEARRIAELNGREEYFGALPVEARARLEEFLRGHLQRIWNAGTLELFALT